MIELKNVHTSVIPLIFILFILVNGSAAQEMESAHWKLAKEQNGIKIFTRKVEDYKLKQFKAVTTLEANPKQLVNVIIGVDRYTEWMSNLERSYMVNIVNENEFYIYAESDVPWPFSNRDIVTKSTIRWDGNIAYLDMTAVSDHVPKNKGIVRMPRSDGQWEFKPVKDDLSEITYTYLGDSGGSIPAWIANMFLVDGPYKTLVGLKAYLKENKEKV